MSSNPELPVSIVPTPDHDPYLWLEDVDSEQALTWVKHQNQLTQKELEQHPKFEGIRQRILSHLNSKEQIPMIAKYGQWYYNFWQDQEHVRGIWRRTTLEEYRQENPAWELVLDLDALAQDENENWVWQGAVVLEPDYDRCLIYLSRGGADASVIREFDLLQKCFIQDGFVLPESKGYASYFDKNHLWIGRDFGEGTLTSSGYPRMIKVWQRGTSLEDAKIVYEGKNNDVRAYGYVTQARGKRHEVITRAKTFYTWEVFLHRDGHLTLLDIPEDAPVEIVDDWLVLHLKSPYQIENKSYVAGTLLAIKLDAFLQEQRMFDVLFEPAPRKVLENWMATKTLFLLNVSNNLVSELYSLSYQEQDWHKTEIDLPVSGNIMLWSEDDQHTDNYFLMGDDYLTPPSLFFKTSRAAFEKLKSNPATFDSSSTQVQRFEVASQDGVMIPYFVVSHKDTVFNKDSVFNGKNPTLLYGYGGFEISLGPEYKFGTWLEQGGIFIEAILRGGGEFGPEWHWAATKENKQRTFDDFISIAEDVIARGISSPQHLGIMGGSNGGLLMGAMLTQRPDLFKAVVCEVPLLDMFRYSQLLAGASWMAEYGDPSKSEEWDYIKNYSPYHTVQLDKNYSRTLFITSTRDDRVHPGHARKMMALMKDIGADVLYFENMEGGHARAANKDQRAYMQALKYCFLLGELS